MSGETAIQSRGDLRHVIQVLEKTQAVDPIGGPAPTYTDTVHTCYGSIEYVRASEHGLRAGTVSFTHDVEITIDYFPIDPDKHQVQITDTATNVPTIYNVTGYDHARSGGRKTVIFCKRGTQ